MGDFPETKEVHTCKGIVCDCKGEDKMTEEELRKQLLLILAFKAFDDNPPTMGEVATKILTLTEQYYREAGYIPCIYEKGPCDGDAECNPFTDCWGCGRRPLGGKGEPK